MATQRTVYIYWGQSHLPAYLEELDSASTTPLPPRLVFRKPSLQYYFERISIQHGRDRVKRRERLIPY